MYGALVFPVVPPGIVHSMLSCLDVLNLLVLYHRRNNGWYSQIVLITGIGARRGWRSRNPEFHRVKNCLFFWFCFLLLQHDEAYVQGFKKWHPRASWMFQGKIWHQRASWMFLWWTKRKNYDLNESRNLENLLVLLHVLFIFWFKYDLGQKYYAPQVRPDRGLNSWPPDHDSTFHVTETPALTTWPSVTSPDTLDTES